MGRNAKPPTPLDTPCREWQLSRDKDGYGIRCRKTSDPPGPKLMKFHRWVWEQINGPVPSGMIVMHKCDNPPCFRYDHLVLGTHADNARDRRLKGRSALILTDEQVREIRDRIADGARTGRLSREYGVAPCTISNIKAGRTRVTSQEVDA